MTQLIDYSTARPSPASIRAAGYSGVLRYLSNYPPKNLSASERDGLLAAGLTIGLVWETTATRANQGFSAGQDDARAAEAQADVLGYPGGCPIFYAVDYDAVPSAVTPYFAGATSVASRPVGVYGSANVVEGVPVPWKWQATAWSRGRVSPQAHLYQRVGGTTLAGTDVNDLLNDLPLWGGASIVSNLLATGGTVTGVPTLTPLVPLTPTVQEDDMRIFRRNSDGAVFLAAPGHVTVLTPEQYQTWQNLGVHAQGMDDWPLEVVLQSLRPTAPVA